jgi:hypothetical protein
MASSRASRRPFFSMSISRVERSEHAATVFVVVLDDARDGASVGLRPAPRRPPPPSRARRARRSAIGGRIGRACGPSRARCRRRCGRRGRELRRAPAGACSRGCRGRRGAGLGASAGVVAAPARAGRSTGWATRTTGPARASHRRRSCGGSLSHFVSSSAGASPLSSRTSLSSSRSTRSSRARSTGERSHAGDLLLADLPGLLGDADVRAEDDRLPQPVSYEPEVSHHDLTDEVRALPSSSSRRTW